MIVFNHNASLKRILSDRPEKTACGILKATGWGFCQEQYPTIDALLHIMTPARAYKPLPKMIHVTCFAFLTEIV